MELPEEVLLEAENFRERLEEADEFGADFDGGGHEVGNGDDQSLFLRALGFEELALIAVQQAAGDSNLAAEHVGSELINCEIDR